LKNSDITIDQVLTLMDKMAKSGLGKIHLEDGSFKLSIEAKEQISAHIGEQTIVSAPMTEAPAVSAADSTADEGIVITSPIVGTFYEAPAPDKQPFVKPGSQVKKGDVLFIVESMKLMNEVLSEFDGTVREILVEDAQPLEYGQPVLILE